MNELREKIEIIITRRLNGMPNYKEYMVNTTMKFLVVDDIIELLQSTIPEKETVPKVCGNCGNITQLYKGLICQFNCNKFVYTNTEACEKWRPCTIEKTPE